MNVYNNELKDLALALSKAQAEFKIPKLNKVAEIKLKTGGGYKFQYADLHSLYDATKDALMKYQLSHTCLIENNMVIGMLIHSSGQRLVSTFPLAPTQDIKALGGNITYARRYLFAAMLGLFAQEDTDGAQEESESVIVTDLPKEKGKSPKEEEQKQFNQLSKEEEQKLKDSIYKSLTQFGWSRERYDYLVRENFGKNTVRELTLDELDHYFNICSEVWREEQPQ
jgi:ERF superfamily